MVYAVLVIPGLNGVGLTLVKDEAGWRFEAWHRSEAHRPLPALPSHADSRRYFDSEDMAAAYFKKQYAIEIRDAD